MEALRQLAEAADLSVGVYAREVLRRHLRRGLGARPTPLGHWDS